MSAKSPDTVAKRIPILLVEDTVAGETRCQKLLGGNFEVVRAADPSEATLTFKDMVARHSFPKCVIMDLTLERDYKDAMPLITALRKDYPHLPILIWTKHSDDIMQQAMTLANGTSAALSKYVGDKNMKKVVMDLIAKSKESY